VRDSNVELYSCLLVGEEERREGGSHTKAKKMATEPELEVAQGHEGVTQRETETDSVDGSREATAQQDAGGGAGVTRGNTGGGTVQVS
jgi:hypothetical protein